MYETRHRARYYHLKSPLLRNGGLGQPDEAAASKEQDLQHARGVTRDCSRLKIVDFPSRFYAAEPFAMLPVSREVHSVAHI